MTRHELRDATGYGSGAGIAVTPRGLAICLISVATALFAAHSIVMIMKHAFGRPYLFGLADMFNMNLEMNVPTLVSTLVLMACAFALAYTATLNRRNVWESRSWALLAFAFAFLSFDENTSIHETTIGPVRNMIQADWVPAFAWVLPYGIAVIVLGLILLPWFLKLDRISQIRFTIAGVIYVGGALGVEVLESMSYEASDPTLSKAGLEAVKQSLSNDILTTTQEFMEIGGASYFLWAIVKRFGGISISTYAPTRPQQ